VTGFLWGVIRGGPETICKVSLLVKFLHLLLHLGNGVLFVFQHRLTLQVEVLNALVEEFVLAVFSTSHRGHLLNVQLEGRHRHTLEVELL
jgi:hypothetical protein